MKYMNFVLIQAYKGSTTIFRWLFLLAISVVLCRCANETVPQGGNRDETPPQATKISPPNKTVNFHDSKIQITFDEYLKASGFSQTVISPPLTKKPDISTNGKHLTIKIKEQLKDSTTYTINFGDDIQDLNEGNIAPNFVYVFSTGNVLDSQSVSGKIILSENNSSEEGVIVSLYPSDSVDGILSSRPLYFSKTNKEGRFTISNIKPGFYNIYALKDQNFNYQFDQPNELIAFDNSTLNLSDTNFVDKDLYLFQEMPTKLKLTSASSSFPGCFTIAYSGPVRSFKLSGELKSEGDIYFTSPSNDTIVYWLSNYYEKNGDFILSANDTVFDTLRMELKFIEKDSIKNPEYFIYFPNNEILKGANTEDIVPAEGVYGPIKIQFARPVVEISKSKQVQYWQDSTENKIPAEIVLDENSRLSAEIGFERDEKKQYTIEVPDSTFLDYLGYWNKRTVYHFKTNKKDAYGNLKITVKGEENSKKYILNLLNTNGAVLNTFSFSGRQEVKFHVDKVLAGGYKFVIVEDSNNNGIWDTGNFRKKIQPEKKIVFKDVYQLKGGWDLDIELKI